MSAFVDSANLRNKSVLLFLRICEENTENIEFCAKKSNCMKLHCNFLAIPRYLHSKLFKLVLTPFLCGAGCSISRIRIRGRMYYIKDPGQAVLYQGSGSGAGGIIKDPDPGQAVLSRIRIWIQIWLYIGLFYEPKIDVNCCMTGALFFGRANSRLFQKNIRLTLKLFTSYIFKSKDNNLILIPVSKVLL